MGADDELNLAVDGASFPGAERLQKFGHGQFKSATGSHPAALVKTRTSGRTTARGDEPGRRIKISSRKPCVDLLRILVSVRTADEDTRADLISFRSLRSEHHRSESLCSAARRYPVRTPLGITAGLALLCAGAMANT